MTWLWEFLFGTFAYFLPWLSAIISFPSSLYAWVEVLQTYVTRETDIEQYSLHIELAKLRRDKWKGEDHEPPFAGEVRYEALQRLERAIESDLKSADKLVGRYRASFGRNYGTATTVAMLDDVEAHQAGGMSASTQKIRLVGFSKTLRWVFWDSRKLRHLSETISANIKELAEHPPRAERARPPDLDLSAVPRKISPTQHSARRRLSRPGGEESWQESNAE